MIDDVLTLITETVTGHDDEGNELVTQTRKEVFCRVRSVTRSEFYAAATASLRPDHVFTLSEDADYDGQTLVEYRGNLYSVIRTYHNTDNLDEIELTVERRIGNG